MSTSSTGPLSLRVFALAIMSVVFARAELRADVITQTQTIPATQTNWTNTLTFNQFNPALGTLTGIQFSEAGNVTSSLSFTNNDPNNSHVFRYSLTADIQLQRPDTSQILDGTVALLNQGPFTLGPGQTLPINPGPQAVSASFTSPPPASDLALFTGTGTIVLPIAANATLMTQGGGNVSGLQLTTAGAGVTVTYTYTPAGPVAAVPEPSSLALFGLGGLGMVLVRRYRRRKGAAPA